MAVGIKDFLAGLRIGATSGAARAELYSTEGDPIARKSGDDISGVNIRSLLIGGDNDGNLRKQRMDRMGSSAVALVTPLLHEPFEGTTVAGPPARWNVVNTTMAAAQTSAGIVINSASITTVTTGYMLTSLKRFLKIARAPLHTKIRARCDFRSNSVIELGFGDASTFNGANTNGAYWQVTAGGVCQPVLTYNSVDITGASYALDPNKFYTFDVILDDDEAIFFIQETSSGLYVAERSIKLPNTQNRLWNSTHIQSLVRLYNTGVAPASAPQLIVTDLFVGVLDSVLNKPWPTICAQNGFGSHINPTTFVQPEQFTNSAAPTNLTAPTNTAASYSTLGGLFSMNALAGAVTDLCIFGFQIPAPYQFTCIGIDVDIVNTGAAAGATPTVFHWFVATQGATVSLADTTSRRRSMGTQSIPAAAAIGYQPAPLVRRFENAAIVCDAGRFFDIGLRIPVGLATASEVFIGNVTIHGWFE